MPMNISNAKGRDAVVAMEGLSPKREVYYRDENGKPVASRIVAAYVVGWPISVLEMRLVDEAVKAAITEFVDGQHSAYGVG